jgi:hypothetical protein
MKKLSLLLVVMLSAAAPAFAQPVVSFSASAGYVPGTLTHRQGAAFDAAVNVQWNRVLFGFHVAEFIYAPANVGRMVEDPATGEVRTERSTEADFDYGVGLDVSYVYPVASAVALLGGVGMRFQQGSDVPEPHYPGPGLTAEIPHLQAGLLIGRIDAVHTAVRVVFRDRLERAQVGVVVPLRFGR